MVGNDVNRRPPIIGEADLKLFAEGRHPELYRHLGAHVTEVDATFGTSFAVWAPAARAVSVAGDFNGWDGSSHPLEPMGRSGVWQSFVAGAGNGQRYMFQIAGAAGGVVRKADPFAFAAERPPATESVITTSDHRWSEADAEWLERRRSGTTLNQPVSVYEVHVGSWRHDPLDGDRELTYLELADELAAHVVALGFTHVELLPVMAHPFNGSWGYQITSYFAPSPKWGSPDDFRALVDRMHAHGIGVILDWVAGHFPRDEWALAQFDGSALYERADPLMAAHPDWGTLIFELGRPEVRNFLLSNALYWLREFHIDGLRADAVASMLYLDYSRQPGQWVPNRLGGRENLEAVSFLRQLNETVHACEPGVLTVAEESTAWPGVSRPTGQGGLGFGCKWNMGWMHDTLAYFGEEPGRRKDHHQLTFSLTYAFSENFVLPLSHDEVVHGKGSLINKMAGDRAQRFASLRTLYALMWAHPGKKLLFMGDELAQEREWSHDRGLDWYLLSRPEHAAVQRLVGDLNRLYRSHPALWMVDFEASGFTWLDCDDADPRVLAFLRHDRAGGVMACVANLSPSPRSGYQLGLPAGAWSELLNTDAEVYRGSSGGAPADHGKPGRVMADGEPRHGQPASATLTLSPLAALWLAPQAPPGSAPGAQP